MKYLFTASIGLVGCRKEEIVELEDDLSEDEIAQEHTDWLMEQVDGGYHKL